LAGCDEQGIRKEGDDAEDDEEFEASPLPAGAKNYITLGGYRA